MKEQWHHQLEMCQRNFHLTTASSSLHSLLVYFETTLCSLQQLTQTFWVYQVIPECKQSMNSAEKRSKTFRKEVDVILVWAGLPQLPPGYTWGREETAGRKRRISTAPTVTGSGHSEHTLPLTALCCGLGSWNVQVRHKSRSVGELWDSQSSCSASVFM